MLTITSQSDVATLYSEAWFYKRMGRASWFTIPMNSLKALLRVLLGLIDGEVIVGPVLLVGAGGADFHFLCGERVEEIRGAPLVE